MNVVRAAEAACALSGSRIGLAAEQGSATRLPHLDGPLMASTANEIANVAAEDLAPGDIRASDLAVESLGDQPPDKAALCPPETVARWSAHPALAPLAAFPSHHQAAMEQILRAAEPSCNPVGKCRLHGSLIMAGTLTAEPAMDQLVLPPISAALGEGPRQLTSILADLGFSPEAAADCPAAEPSLLVPPGGPTFEHFTVLDLRLDRSQPPTLPLPEDDDGAQSAQHGAGPHPISAVTALCPSMHSSIIC